MAKPNSWTALELELRSRLEGEVRFDAASRALYATDSSNYRQPPIGVVVPRSVGDVVETVAVCRAHDAPILSRGAGTSLAGQTCNAAVIIDFSKHLNRVLEIDPRRRLARVQPGAILDDLRNAAEAHRLTFGPDPATHDRCTIGGMIGNNSCGIHSVMAGRTSDNVEELEVLTYAGKRVRLGPGSCSCGEIHSRLTALSERAAPLVRERYPRIPRRVSGFNLDDLLPENQFHAARAFVGSEGTCGIVLEATLRLVSSPPARALAVLGFPDVYTAADVVHAIMEFKPTGLEGMDDYLRNFLQQKRGLRPEEIGLLPEGTGWLLVEMGGETRAEAEDNARRMMRAVAGWSRSPSMKLMSPRQEKLVWDVRKSGLGATAFLPGNKNTWPGWEDAAVPPARLGDYLREFDKLRRAFEYECAMYGHFGDGCVHMRIDFDMFTAPGVAKFVRFLDEAADLAVAFGGSLSGEHGDGQARAHLLPRMFGPELVGAFREFKSIWDPANRMNPGKVVDPYGPGENLRLGPGYKPWQPETVFAYQESNRQFSRALLRCVGVGRCRRLEGGAMCPSFMATREETHSTRGRARLLQEMLRGEIVDGRWSSEEVRNSLETCLSCKSCKTDCPVNVDMATYKAEFMYHYHQRHARPLGGALMALMPHWIGAAAAVPAAANAVLAVPGVEWLMKAVGGVGKNRSLPRLASKSFRRWLAGQPRNRRPGLRGKALLWADTFSNFFLPDTARAGLEVLEAAGFEVILPRQRLCCGRPFFDQGMLGLARRMLRKVMDALRDEIEAGIPLVGLEPGCVSVFKDELPGLFPGEPLAAKLSAQSYLLAEFLAKHAPDWSPPPLGGKALYHAHCHHKALAGVAADEAMLAKLGLEWTAPEVGCCGMAGSFGFSAKTCEMSMAIGELRLLPAIREAEADTLVICDGFSCREQIRQGAGRESLHLAQVLQAALRNSFP